MLGMTGTKCTLNTAIYVSSVVADKGLVVKLYRPETAKLDSMGPGASYARSAFTTLTCNLDCSCTAFAKALCCSLDTRHASKPSTSHTMVPQLHQGTML